MPRLRRFTWYLPWESVWHEVVTWFRFKGQVLTPSCASTSPIAPYARATHTWQLHQHLIRIIPTINHFSSVCSYFQTVPLRNVCLFLNRPRLLVRFIALNWMFCILVQCHLKKPEVRVSPDSCHILIWNQQDYILILGCHWGQHMRTSYLMLPGNQWSINQTESWFPPCGVSNTAVIRRISFINWPPLVYVCAICEESYVNVEWIC